MLPLRRQRAGERVPMNYLEAIDDKTPQFGDLYDELPLWSAPFGLMLLEHVGLRPGMTILDVGAGTGFLTIELAQRCGSHAKVIAVDPWEAAMTRLMRKLDHLGIQNVRTIVQDAATIDLPDASVDLIVSNLGINNFDNREAVLRSCFRVAKPGAKVFLTTNLVGHMREVYEAYRGVLVELGFTGQLAALDAHIAHRATVDSVRTLLEREGFKFVEAVTRSFRERFVDGSSLLRHYFIRLGFVPAWKSVAPDGAVAATFAALENRLNAVAAQRGELSLTIPAACIEACKPAIA
ncbi:MAG TPA: methyltransferase domain-containing protein [Pirellulales bacterium]|nr:methyltransferase domain-containing protein [Pirellulales bacterium]